jgi:hypothetical protein
MKTPFKFSSGKLTPFLTKIVLAESHGSDYYPSNPWEHL